MTARGCTDNRGGPESASPAHAPGSTGGDRDRWRNSLPPEAFHPESTSTLLERGHLSQVVLDVFAVLFGFLFVVLTAAAIVGALYLLFFASS